MPIHLYTRCWNDADMLPYFFRHYDDLVDRYVIYDDGSTDRSLELLTSNSRTEVKQFPPPSDPESRIESGRALQEMFWRESRGSADWVIVTDIDEHLYHRQMRDYLAACKIAGVTVVPALGFQMLSETFPSALGKLIDLVTSGAPDPVYSKMNIFDPNEIITTNFVHGRHSAEPEGRILLPPSDEVLLLHYRYLGFARTHRRHQLFQMRQRRRDLAMKWGAQYGWSEAQLREVWEAIRSGSIDVTGPDVSHCHHPRERWWAYLPRSAALPSWSF